MEKALIGYTGFVGSNLSCQENFNYKYNSSNIEEIREKKFDLIVSAGTYGEIWIVNRDPVKDLENIQYLIDQLKKVQTKKFVLISTIEVYDNPVDVDEDSKISTERLQAYGKNRLYLEDFVKDKFEDYHICRLPNLFGNNLKKNFLYDLFNRAPKFITSNKFQQILSNLESAEQQTLEKNYEIDKNDNYQLENDLSKSTLDTILGILDKVHFTSLVFTHKDSIFQYYNLNLLWKDIHCTLKHDLKIVNFATEPVSARDMAKELCGLNFTNITDKPPVNYNFKTKYDSLFKGARGYLYTKNEVYQQIRSFISKDIDNRS